MLIVLDPKDHNKNCIHSEQIVKKVQVCILSLLVFINYQLMADSWIKPKRGNTIAIMKRKIVPIYYPDRIYCTLTHSAFLDYKTPNRPQSVQMLLTPTHSRLSHTMTTHQFNEDYLFIYLIISQLERFKTNAIAQGHF